MVMIYALGHVSGGHLNPSISLAYALAGKMSAASGKAFATADGDNGSEMLEAPRNFLVNGASKQEVVTKLTSYVFSQLAGGLVGAFAYCNLFGEQLALKPAPDSHWWAAGICEVMYTAMLCFVALNTAGAKGNTPNQFYGLAIGFVLIAGGYAAGPISGGAFNPAVSIGIDISSYADGIYWCVPYCFFQFMGSALAVILFRLVRPEEYTPPPETISNQVPED